MAPARKPNNMNNFKNPFISEKNKPALIISVLLLSALTSFWMLPSQSLDSHECFVSVTAREMIQNHEYVWPTMNGVPRLQKTPLCYWLVAGVAKLTGNVDELSARLPSALFAFLSAVAILYYLSQWLSLQIAAISTAVWSTSLAYIRCSHSARPDMVMAFFIVLCMLSFYSILISQNRRQQIIHGLIFWISFALANLAKGPAPVPYVLIPVAVYMIFSKQWHIVARMLPLVGSFIFLVIVLPWPLFIANRLNWDLIVWKHEFVDRLFGNYDSGDKPVYYYLLIMFKYTMPWVVFLPIALFTPFYKVWRTKRPIITYLWIWFVADIIFLSLSGGKRQHYILPLIPPIAIVIGIILNDMFFSRKAYSSDFIKNALKAHAIVLILLALAAPVVMSFIAQQYVGRVVIISIIILTGFCVAMIFLKKNNKIFACITMFVSITIFVIAFSLCFSSTVDNEKYTRDFARKIASIVPAPDRLVTYKNISSIFVQYYGQIVPEITDFSKLREHYNQGDWIVCLSGNVTGLKDENYNIIYACERKDKSKSDSTGVLFHKLNNTRETLKQ